MGNQEKNTETSTFACTNCGADLTFTPGTTELQCQYCKTANHIEESDEEIVELDYHDFLVDQEDQSEHLTINVVQCENCGATSTLEANIQSASCPYCTTPLIVEERHGESIIKPRSLLPFHLDAQEAMAQFETWVKGLWFAPGALKQKEMLMDKFKGVYLPFWTYDSDAYTSYVGQRGIYYYVTETYTTTEDGKTVTKTRQVRKTRWYNVSGDVFNAFDDVLIPAAHSLPEKYVRELEPWDLENLKPFDQSYLSGFITEKYQRNLEEGFTEARHVMETVIRKTVIKHIGGDRQRIRSMRPVYEDITFKHILLPVFVSSYTFKDKLFQFVVNARTGEVQGQRPWSWAKIGSAVLLVAGLIGGFIYYANLQYPM